MSYSDYWQGVLEGLDMAIKHVEDRGSAPNTGSWVVDHRSYVSRLRTLRFTKELEALQDEEGCSERQARAILAGREP